MSPNLHSPVLPYGQTSAVAIQSAREDLVKNDEENRVFRRHVEPATRVVHYAGTYPNAFG